MGKASVIELVDALSNRTASPATVESFYKEAIIDLARRGWIVQASMISVLAGVGDYPLPEEAVTLLAVFFDDTQLSEVSQRGLEWHDPQWRDRVGFPVAWTAEKQSAKTFQVFPAPETESDPFLPGELSLGPGFPRNAITLFHTEVRTDFPDWLDLPLALLVLEKEFSYESAHRDLVFARACGELATALLTMVR